MLKAAARRFVVMLAVAFGATALVSLLFGLALGSDPNRAVSLGLYLVGCFLMVIGFFAANRGPMRLRNEESLVGFRRPRVLRPAGLSEQAESVNVSAILVVIGIVLLLAGVGIDSRYELV